MRGLAWICGLLLAAGCDFCDVDGTEDAEAGDTEAAVECACFEADMTSVEMLCDPGTDCGVVELACPATHDASLGPGELDDTMVVNPEVLACALDLIVHGEAGSFGYQQGLDLGQRRGTFYTDGFRGFAWDYASYDVSYELSPVVAGPLGDTDHLRACADNGSEALFACLRSAIDHVEEECTPHCSDGFCDDG